jgi:membrane associated rhomboid family serine protease
MPTYLVLLIPIITCHLAGTHVTYAPHAPWWAFLTFHFFHTNIWHLLANTFALLTFKPRPLTLAVAYIIATAAALLDTFITAQPTCGLSAILCAAYARRYAAWQQPIWTPLALLTATALLPHVNAAIHILSFLFAYAFWRNYYQRR